MHPRENRFWTKTWIPLCVAAAALSAPPARATWFDIFGYDARASALGAFTAVATDASSTYYNPGGLGFAEGLKVQLGYMGAIPWLHSSLVPATPGGSIVQSLDAGQRAAGFFPADHPGQPQGQTIGISTPLGFTGSVGKSVGFGIGMFIPLPSIVKIKLHQEEGPYWLDYDTLPYAITILPATGFRITNTLSVGFGASLLADIPGNIAVASTPIGNVSNNGSIDLVPKVSPEAGVMWQPSPRFSAGFSFRGRTSVDASIDASANIDPQALANKLLPGLKTPVPDWLDPSVRGTVAPYLNGISKGVDVHLATSDLYSPDQYSVGAAWRPIDPILLTGDLTLARWSSYTPPFSDVTISFRDPALQKLASKPVVGAPFNHIGYAAANFKDITIPRIGVELTPLSFLALRAGYAFRPSPVPNQTFVSNIEDGDTQILSGGFGITYAFPESISPATVQMDFYAEYRMMSARTNLKSTDPAVYAAYYLFENPAPGQVDYAIDDPGYPGYTSKGTAASVGATLTIRYPAL